MLQDVREEFLGVHGIHFDKLRDPHPEADAFIAASDEERAALRTQYGQILADRIARGIAALRAAPPPVAHSSSSKYAKRRDLDSPIDVERVRSLVQSGNSVRHIEKLTGIGRNRIRRLIDSGFTHVASPIRAWSWLSGKVAHDARGRFTSRIVQNAA